MNRPLRIISDLSERLLARHQKRLARSRQHWTEADFVTYFTELGVGPEIATAVWRQLQPEIMVEGFTPAPEDDLGTVFRIAEEELDEFVLSLLTTCSCRIPPASETKAMTPIRTVRDLVEFLAKMKIASIS
jgi:hypothetical protein